MGESSREVNVSQIRIAAYVTSVFAFPRCDVNPQTHTRLEQAAGREREARGKRSRYYLRLSRRESPRNLRRKEIIIASDEIRE